MQLPFSDEQFFQVIRDYNLAVWPGQLAFNALAVAALVLLFVRRPWSSRLIWGILALLWAWIGVVYQLVFFTAINPAAYAFGALFIAVAVVFAWAAVRDRHRFAPAGGAAGVIGTALIVYALVAYPLWATAAGHGYPELPTFGLPCPTTIFTIGMLAFAAEARRGVFLGPVLWAAVGTQAAFLLDVLPDLGLGVAGLVALWLAFRPGARPAHGR